MWPWRHESKIGQRYGRGKAARRRPLQVEWLEPRQVMAVSILSPLPDVVLSSKSPNQSIPLAGLYDDTAVGGTIVRFDVNTSAPLDRIYVELFDKTAPGRTRVTPVTAANFLQYVDAGHYANTMIHRSVPGFVVQGGGFNVTPTGPLQIGNVTNLGQIVNEPGPVGSTNVRGTIAMAKLGGDPNSASNQWFFNLSDNRANLDNQNGGFTTFGRVLGGGMNAVDAIASVPRFRYGSPYDSLPLRNVPNPVLIGQDYDPLLYDFDPTIHYGVDPDTLTRSQFVMFPSIVRVGELVYSVTTDNTPLVTPGIVDGRLDLAFAPGGVGTATVSVRVESVFDSTDFVVDSFVVSRRTPVIPDALAADNGTALWVSESNGTSLETRRAANLPSGRTWVSHIRGDFDGDRRSDAAARDAEGTWWVAITPPASSPPAVATAWDAWSPTVAWENLMAIDVDGDGRDDIVGRDPGGGGWWVARSNGTGFTTTSFGGWSTAVPWSLVTPGDFDRDGRIDVAARDPGSGSWWVARSTGSVFVTTLFGNWSPTATWEGVVAGDFDADGRTDIAGRNAASGAWFVARSTGAAFVTTRFGAWTTSTQWGSIVVGDFDGDGRADIAGRDQSRGHWWVSRSTGTGFTTSRAGSWSTTISWQSIVVGDFNNDGRADVAGRDANTGGWWVGQSEGAGEAFRLTNRKFGSWSRNVAWTNIRAVLG